MKTAEFSRIIYANISAILQSNNKIFKFSHLWIMPIVKSFSRRIIQEKKNNEMH